MNDIFALWSLPWHTLQRSLAAGISMDGAVHALRRRAAPVGNVAVIGNSWLARARENLNQTAAWGK